MFKEKRKELENMADDALAQFTAKLCPDTDSSRILGIKVPELRKIAKSIVKEGKNTAYIEEAMNFKKEKYLEEILLEGFVIGYSKIPLDQKLEYIKLFIPQIDNWLINDTVCSTLKVKKEDELKKLWSFILPYLKSKKQFEVRYAVTTMLGNFIIEEYVDKVIEELDKIENKEYYTEMAVAWTLAEVGIKFNDKAMKYLNGKNSLDKFTYNKTLQKMIESYRISESQKVQLRAMKRE